MKEAYHIFDIPPELMNDPRIDKNIKELGVIDLVIELYDDPSLFQVGREKQRVPRRFVKIPYVNKDKEGFLYYDGLKKEFVSNISNDEEVAVLPNDWYKKSAERMLTERKVKKKRDLSIIKTLAVFDFDDTLFQSPEAPKGYKGNWHIKPESLPDNPKEKDWNLDIVSRAMDMCEDPSVYCVMMTGRIGNIFGEKIDYMLKGKGLNFAKTYYNEFGGDTAQYKMDEINKLLGKLPNVQNLLMWEDQREKAEKYSEEFSKKINYKIHMVGDEELNESGFEDVKYDKDNVGLITLDKTKFILFDTKKLINFVSSLPKDNPDMDSNELIDNNIILSYAAVTPNDKLKNPCMGATERSILAQNPNIKGSGMGRYMMGVLFKFYPEGMMNDRGDVSQAAKQAARLLSLSGLAKVKKIKDGGETVDKLDDIDNPKTATKKDDCEVHNDDLLDKVYLYNDPSINEQALLKKGQEALEVCEQITEGNWPTYALEDLIEAAGMALYYRSIDTTNL